MKKEVRCPSFCRDYQCRFWADIHNQTVKYLQFSHTSMVKNTTALKQKHSWSATIRIQLQTFETTWGKSRQGSTISFDIR